MFKLTKKPMVVLLIIAFTTVSIATNCFAQAAIEGSEITTEEMVADAIGELHDLIFKGGAVPSRNSLNGAPIERRMV